MSAAATDGETVISVRGIRTAFGSTVIHESLDLDVRRGEIIGLVGGSGTGKSVLLETILGLKTPDAGNIHILGHDIHELTQHQSIQSRIGVMFQNGALFSALTVRENVEAPLIEHTDFPADFIRGLADIKIRLAGLPDAAGTKKPAELSGGMRKRAGVARAIALDPELLFLDEPTAGLDPVARDHLLATLRALARDGITLVLVTHHIEEVIPEIDRVLLLREGTIYADGDRAGTLTDAHLSHAFGGPVQVRRDGDYYGAVPGHA